jgi:hypothetical protein
MVMRFGAMGRVLAATAIGVGLAAPAMANYPEATTKQLLSACYSGADTIPLGLPFDRAKTTTPQVLIQPLIAEVNQQGKAAEAEVEQQVQERQAQLNALAKDKTQLASQIQRLKDAIAAKQVSGAQLVEVQQLLKELTDVQANPAAVQQKTKENRDKLIAKLRQEQSREIKRLQDCVCLVDGFQKKNPVDVFYKRAIEELTTGTAGVTKDWSEAKATCSKTK